MQLIVHCIDFGHVREQYIVQYCAGLPLLVVRTIRCMLYHFTAFTSQCVVYCTVCHRYVEHALYSQWCTAQSKVANFERLSLVSFHLQCKPVNTDKDFHSLIVSNTAHEGRSILVAENEKTQLWCHLANLAQ